MVFSAKRERPIRIDDFLKLASFGVELVEVDVVGEHDVRFVRHHARRRNLSQQLIDVRDLDRSTVGVIRQCLLRNNKRACNKQSHNCQQKCKREHAALAAASSYTFSGARYSISSLRARTQHVLLRPALTKFARSLRVRIRARKRARYGFQKVFHAGQPSASSTFSLFWFLLCTPQQSTTSWNVQPSP